MKSNLYVKQEKNLKKLKTRYLNIVKEGTEDSRRYKKKEMGTYNLLSSSLKGTAER